MFKLRDYQQEAVDSIYEYFSKHDGNPLLALPTASGKSVIIAEFVRTVCQASPNVRVIMLTHSKELVDQNYKKFMSMWEDAPCGVYSAGLKRKELDQIVFGSIQSLSKVAHKLGHVDIAIIDECHLVSPKQDTMYNKFIEKMLDVNPKFKVIGLTATPWRLGHGHLTENHIFTDVCYDLTTLEKFNWMIEQGYLSQLVPKKTNLELDLSDVRIKGGEFNEQDLQGALDKDEITREALREAITQGDDRKHWLVFTTGIEHSDNVANMLNCMGIPAVSIHSKLTNEQRDKALDDYKAGVYKVAVNPNILTTGFDFPSIDFIILLRPTMSSALWVQMAGRGLRIAEGKANCLLLDFAGNTARLGPINDPVIPKPKGKRKGEGKAPVRLCTQCQAYNHAKAVVCINCGFEFPKAEKLKTTASELEIIRSAKPVFEEHFVQHITYQRHKKTGSDIASLKVTYHCILRTFTKYVFLEHEGKARKLAEIWWRNQRGGYKVPATVAEALELTDNLLTPTHIKVKINQQWPDIVDYNYDGSGFDKKVTNE